MGWMELRNERVELEPDDNTFAVRVVMVVVPVVPTMLMMPFVVWWPMRAMLREIIVIAAPRFAGLDELKEDAKPVHRMPPDVRSAHG